ncbi:NAD(P)-dependent oxidoreductase [Roseateles sp. SL47]|uniref:NAD(P)-dependent oxidoreductase n=1 Tax=Roseateles sp. SL47 TaxID=2995138 RepID=UPI00226FA2E6|nr:NAD(P)-dependent oxidoreductase [Roseateles sp. SL47]WAC73448.1 NAD(P)-dependent oxidoreductase [Roseateles sp. SL47]
MSARIAFLGLGAMGSRMAARLVQAGHHVMVWNRSPAPARALASAGARRALSPREAADGADFVIAMVRDDEASRDVWCHPETGALTAMAPGSVAIESSTLSLGGLRTLQEAAGRAGIDLLDAPVSGSRPAAEAGQLVFLVGGAAEPFERARPVLQAMGGAVQHVGPVGHGALAKLVTNTLLGVHVAALAELLGLLHRQGVPPQTVLQAVAGTPVWAPVDHYLSTSMLKGDFSPQFPVELIAKDFAYALSAGGGMARMPLAAAAMDVYHQALAQSMGAENMTAVARLYGASAPAP